MAPSEQSYTVKDAARMAGPEPDQAPVLYTHLCCPYAQRSLLCLLQKLSYGAKSEDSPGYSARLSIVQVDLSSKPSCSGSWAVGRSHTKPQRRAFEAQLQALEGPLQQSGGPFLAGAAVSLADFILWPFLERCKMILPEFQGYKVEDHAGQAVVAWMTAMQELHSVKMAAPDERAFLSAVRTHMRLDFFDFHSYDAASTHPHLA
ncbi:hypothetical protein WJX73_009562 [Symbiochloris irregularis]|uniref:Uncharacterized protein n=1 Tax=Symbiochloris irregularis TaxID=706552 RepID=A0AAW1P031_9CHLO